MAYRHHKPADKSKFLTQNFTDSLGNTYRLKAAQSLVAWYRFESITPKDLGPNKIGATYQGSPPNTSFTNQKLGDVAYPSVLFSDSGNDYALAGSGASKAKFSFSKSASGAAPSASSDKPFTFSLWFRADNLSGYQGLISKYSHFTSGPTTSYHEYIAYIHTDDTILFKIMDHTNTATQQVKTTGTVVTNTWYHAVFSYDGRGGANAADGLKIYLNGSLAAVSATKDAGYQGVKPNHATELDIGAYYSAPWMDRISQIDGNISELAIWNVDLGSEEILAIYNETRRIEAYSGFITHSDRIQSIDVHNTHSSHGPFDDLRTIDFVDPRYVAEIEFTRVPKDAQTITITENKSVVAKSKIFEFQKDVKLEPGNIEVNIKDSRTPAQCARKFVNAVNSQTTPGWSYTAIQTTPTRVKIIRNDTTFTANAHALINSAVIANFNNDTVTITRGEMIRKYVFNLSLIHI